jgi:hypothetical protein
LKKSGKGEGVKRRNEIICIFELVAAKINIM